MDPTEICALYYAEKYGDLSFLVAMMRSGNKLIIEDESIRNFIADRLEGKPLRRKGEKPANQEKEERDVWVVTHVAIYLCQGLPLYYGKNSPSYGKDSAFSKVIEHAKQLGYPYLGDQKTIQAALKRHFKRVQNRFMFSTVLACAQGSGGSLTDEEISAILHNKLSPYFFTPKKIAQKIGAS